MAELIILPRFLNIHLDITLRYLLLIFYCRNGWRLKWRNITSTLKPKFTKFTVLHVAFYKSHKLTRIYASIFKFVMHFALQHGIKGYELD